MSEEKKKTKKDTIIEFLKAGKTVAEIVEETGFRKQLVYWHKKHSM